MIRVAFDIGGTFTDFVLSDDRTNATHALKVPTSSRNPGEAVVEGLEKLLAATGVRGNAVDVVLHATTVATNAVLERKGAKTGLITTAGFRDVLIIGRQKRYETYDMYIDKPEPLVQRRHIVEVIERVAADGTVVTPLDEASIRRHRRDAGGGSGDGRGRPAARLRQSRARTTDSRTLAAVLPNCACRSPRRSRRNSASTSAPARPSPMPT